MLPPVLHQPVLLSEALDSLNIQPCGNYIDATFGRGGHAREILTHLSVTGRLVALDADPEAVAYAREHFSDDRRFVMCHSNFAHLAEICEREQIAGAVGGVLLDLGVSSPQLDQPARGFSFSHDGPLDMRMDTSCGISAHTWLAGATEMEMAEVFWRYGEERYSRRIARSLVERRQVQAFDSTLVLAEAVKRAHPRWERDKHPATRVFQAIRIYINRELDSLRDGLASMVDMLAIGGRLVVISFHSLEDRIVKRFFRGDHNAPAPLRGLPIPQCAPQWLLRPLGGKIRPCQTELDGNPRARSAIMRVAEKIA